MASGSLTQQLSKSRYNNWVKASLAVLFTKEGIEPFVEDEIEQLQQKCLRDICIKEGLPAGSICSNCCTENVVKCPTNRICNFGRGKCSYHRSFATKYLPNGCPNKVCHNFKTDIQNMHRYHGPSYKNTDATQWCSNPWEVAKCFMPPDGYKDVGFATETDFNGINSVIINCSCFQTKVTDDLSKKGNIFDRGRDIGRAVRQAPTLEVDDTDLKQYFIDLDKLLSDPAHLLSDKHAKIARQKLARLINNTLVIGKDDVRKALDDVANVAQGKIKTLEDEFQIKVENEKSNLIRSTHESLEALEGKDTLAISELIKVLENSVDTILKRIKTEADTVAKRVKIQADKGVKIVKTQADTGVKEIKTQADTEVNRIKTEADTKGRRIKTQADTGLKQVNIQSGKEVKQVKTQAETGVKQVKTQADRGVKLVNTQANTGVTRIKTEAVTGVKQVKTKTDAGVKQVKAQADKEVKQVKTQAETGVKQFKIQADTGVKLVKTQAYSGGTRIKEEAETGVKQVKTKADTRLKQVKTQPDTEVKQVKTQAERGVKQVKTQADSGRKLVKIQSDTDVKRIETTIEGVENKVKAAAEQITTVIHEGKKKLCTASKQRQEDNYKAVKRDLQSDLIQLLRDSCSRIDICPDLDEVDASLIEVYIPPYPLYSKKTNNLKDELGGKPVYFLKEIFNKQSEECRNIYLTAKQRLGKTLFVKWLALNWCHAHYPINEYSQYFKESEVSQMKKFDFVFLIFLRETNDIHVDSMIQNYIFDNIGKQNIYTTKIIERVLCDEKCLIILDGLDELNVFDIPKVRSIHQGCTFITTSRSSKFYTLSLTSNQIDQHVSIENIQSFCEEKLIFSIMTMFEKRLSLRNDMSNIQDASLEFITMIYKKGMTYCFQTPSILVKELVLWNMETNVGNSQCEIYCDKIDALFSRSEFKVDLKQFENKRSSKIAYFKGSFCEKYYDLMVRLGKLAFYTLFLGDKESSLVFVEDVALRYLSDDDSNSVPNETLIACLRIGLLSKHRKDIRARRKKCYYSFQNKTIQEYFSAIFIQSEYKNELKEIITSKCYTVSTILEMGTVFMFLSGLSPKVAEKVIRTLQCTISEYEKTLEYRKMSIIRFNEGYNQIMKIQDMVLTCVEESRKSRHKEVKLPLEDILIDVGELWTRNEYNDSFKRLMRHNCKNLKSLCYEVRPLFSFPFDIEDIEYREANNPPSIDIFKHFEWQKMQCLCKLHISIDDRGRGRCTSSFNTIATQLAALNSENLKSLYISFVRPVTGFLMETLLQFVIKQTKLIYIHLDAKTNEKLKTCLFNQIEDLHTQNQKHVPISMLKLNEHLEQMTLIDIPVSQLQLNEHLEQMTLINVPLLQLQLNERLQTMTLIDVPVSQLQLNENLNEMTLENVPVSTLQLNEHLHTMTLENIPLSQLQLNEHLHNMTLIDVPVSQLQLNGHLQIMTLERISVSQLQMNENLQQRQMKNVQASQIKLNKHLQYLTLTNLYVSKLQLIEELQKLDMYNSNDIKKKLFDVLGCISALYISSFIDQLEYLTCQMYFPESRTAQEITLTNGIGSIMIKLYSERKTLLHLRNVTLTSKALYKLSSIQCDYDLEVKFSTVKVEDTTSENEVETTLKESLSTEKVCSNRKIIIHFFDVIVSSKTFLQFVKFVETCNSSFMIVIPLPVDHMYTEGVKYVRSSTLLIIKEQMSNYWIMPDMYRSYTDLSLEL